jgi:nicotinamidase-related amidase
VNIGALYGRGVTQVAIVGVATGSGVEATARQAYDQGYNVVLVTDAMTDLNPDMHEHAVEKVFPRIRERVTTEEILEIL